MINQEEVYKWLIKGEYKKLIDLLHQEKEAIKSDQILSHAAKTSVTEILRISKKENNPSSDFVDNLERLNLIFPNGRRAAQRTN
ncbi:MAG: hypothetical protein R2774_15495 [Saprospiraceae bacterium]